MFLIQPFEWAGDEREGEHLPRQAVLGEEEGTVAMHQQGSPSQTFLPKPCFWQLLHCLYKIQEEFLAQVMAHFQGRRLYVQNDMELLMLTFYFKSCCCMKRLQLNEGGQHRQAQRPHTVVL